MKILFVLAIAFALWLVLKPKKRKSHLELPKTFPEKWRKYLDKHVLFYHKLDAENRAQFEKDTLRFLATVRISGVKTNVSDEDRLLVASSAVIPVFAFPDWEYSSLHEVLLYPDLFDQNFSLSDDNRNISGMVGSGGVMNNIVIFSKPALHQGFIINNDKRNVGIHEFVHLFDKEDHNIDGLPQVILDHQATLPWIDLMQKNMKAIREGKSDIDFYGATNPQEFLAVVSEYFFERPDLLKKKHPELYSYMTEIFKQDRA